MEELLSLYSKKLVGFSRGQKVDATLTDLSKRYASFDVGGKSEAVLNDIYFQEARDYLKTLKIGDKVQATIVEPETKEGYVLISLKNASSDSIWDSLYEAMEKDLEISVIVKNVTPSGVVVEYGMVSGFIPMSQVGKKTFSKIESFMDKSIKVKVLDVDRDHKKVVFSEKYVSEADEIKKINKALTKIKEGEIYTGHVSNITDFGAFVAIDIDKITVEGLVHFSELSWDKSGKPSDYLSEGDKVKVKVIGVKQGKLALSIKQAAEDPWSTASKKYKVEDKFKGKVSRISDFGAFVVLEPGIEGLIHITKIPPAQKIKVSDTVHCYIEEIDPENRKISLGLVLTSKPVAYK